MKISQVSLNTRGIPLVTLNPAAHYPPLDAYAHKSREEILGSFSLLLSVYLQLPKKILPGKTGHADVATLVSATLPVGEAGRFFPHFSNQSSLVEIMSDVICMWKHFMKMFAQPLAFTQFTFCEQSHVS